MTPGDNNSFTTAEYIIMIICILIDIIIGKVAASLVAIIIAALHTSPDRIHES